ncbi:MAG: hypothetical protein U0R24_04590 [Solirubrobacterales bacterium]
MSLDSEKELFKKAAEIASVVPEPMQDAAFQRALDMLQESDGRPQTPSKPSGSGKRARTQRQPAKDSTTTGQSTVEVLVEGIDRTAHSEVSEAPKVLERALHILKIGKDEFEIDGMSANEIATVLTEKFRLRTTRQRVNQVLDEASGLVDRVPRPGRQGAQYRIMHPGEKYLANPSEEDKPKASARKSPKRAGAGKRTARSKTSSKAPGRRKRVQGPRASLQDLLEAGYLDEPRTIGDLRDRLESKKGRIFKLGDLSPTLTRMLRDGLLDREKNEAGQYEYKRA